MVQIGITPTCSGLKSNKLKKQPLGNYLDVSSSDSVERLPHRTPFPSNPAFDFRPILNQAVRMICRTPYPSRGKFAFPDPDFQNSLRAGIYVLYSVLPAADPDALAL